MYSESRLKSITVVSTIVSFVVIFFSCRILYYIIGSRRLISEEVFYIGIFSTIILCVLSIIVTLLAYRTRKSLEDEVIYLRARIMDIEKELNIKGKYR